MYYEIDQKYVEIIETNLTVEINGLSVPYIKLTARVDYPKARFFEKEDSPQTTLYFVEKPASANWSPLLLKIHHAFYKNYEAMQPTIWKHDTQTLAFMTRPFYSKWVNEEEMIDQHEVYELLLKSLYIHMQHLSTKMRKSLDYLFLDAGIYPMMQEIAFLQLDFDGTTDLSYGEFVPIVPQKSEVELTYLEDRTMARFTFLNEIEVSRKYERRIRGVIQAENRVVQYPYVRQHTPMIELSLRQLRLNVLKYSYKNLNIEREYHLFAQYGFFHALAGFTDIVFLENFTVLSDTVHNDYTTFAIEEMKQFVFNQLKAPITIFEAPQYEKGKLEALGFTHVPETKYFYLRATEYAGLKVDPIELHDNGQDITRCFDYGPTTVTELNHYIYAD